MLLGMLKAPFWVGAVTGLMALPGALANTDVEPGAQRWITSTVFFENANACMWAGVPTRVCQAGYRSAYRQHVRIAPAYREREDCEADFAPGECFVSGASHLWSPWLSGFSLITHARLPPSALQAQRVSQMPMGQLNRTWSQHLQGVSQSPELVTQVRYFSAPLYWERDLQGGFRLTTLLEKLRSGERFAKAFSKRPPVNAGSALWTRQLARVFEPQRLMDAGIP